MNVLKDLFIQNFNMERVALDLIELIDENTLENYIMKEFCNNFTYGEIYDLFKSYLGVDELKIILEKMGHDFVDLDKLNKKEREKFY